MKINPVLRFLAVLNLALFFVLMTVALFRNVEIPELSLIRVLLLGILCALLSFEEGQK